jgi:arylsulfatase A-like enzyme
MSAAPAVRPFVAVSIVAIAASAIVYESSGARPHVADLNLLIITLDTTRADRIGAYGYSAQTPNLDRLAREGTVFEQTTSASPLTLPAHGSLFTGQFSPGHGVRANGGFFSAAEHTTLADVLKRHGFATGAFVGSYVLDSRFGLDQGFDTYIDDFDGSYTSRFTASSLQRPANEVVDRALTWLRQTASTRFFAWLHFYDPHAPYEPPEPYRAMFADDPYVGEIAFVDAQLGRMVAFLEERHLLDRTIVVVIGDHGESLGDHGELTHGRSLYESVLRVPFIMRVPLEGFAGQRVGGPALSVDMMPTLLDLLQIAQPEPVDGTSLVPAVSGATAGADRVAFAETPSPESPTDLRMVRLGRFKLIAAPRLELYDLAEDPAEQRNLTERNAALAQSLMWRLHDLEYRMALRHSEGRSNARARDGTQASGEKK